LAILEKEVWIGLSKNISYYENLGYEIPKNEKGRVNKGQKILVKIEDLTRGSKSMVTKICDICGNYSENQYYENIVRNRRKGIDMCRKCSNISNAKSRMKNIKFQNSLEYYAKNNNSEYLIKEFSIKNKRTPREVSFGSNYKYLWQCDTCGSDYSASITSRTSNNSGCPYCTGIKINSKNNLWRTHPEVAKMLLNMEEGYNLTYGSNKKQKFLCKDCGAIKEVKVATMVRSGISCSKCGDGFSYPEKILFNALEQIGVTFYPQKVFEWSNKKRYDFYIPAINSIVEVHGNQHYEETTRGRTLREEQENDLEKEELAIVNGIENYIVIDCRFSNMNYIKTNILDSKLSLLLNLKDLDWKKCNTYATTSLVKVVCEIWEEHAVISTSKISRMLNISRSSVKKYLLQGTDLGYCDYDPNQVRYQNGKSRGGRNKRSVVKIDSQTLAAEEFHSIKEAANKLNINTSGIHKVLKNSRKTAGGYKWMYKEDYEKYIQQQAN
jgi:hypothetical protein